MPDLGVVGEADDLLDQLLAALVGRVRLAGDHELHRTLRVEQQALEALGVAEHQRQPLVRRDAAGEADGEHVGVERVVDPGELGRGRPALLPRLRQALAGVLDEAVAQHALGRPDLGGRDLVGDVEHGDRVVGVRVGAGTHAVVTGQVEDLAGHPGRGVHAVGDRGDRALVGVELRPQAAEHVAADVAVQLRDAVGALREAEAHDGHVEDRRVAGLEVLGAERQDLVDRDAGAGVVAAEVLRDQVAREAVDAGRDRRVGGEHGAGAGDLQRGVEVEVLLLGELADALEAEEAGVALVGVEHLGVRGAGDAGVGAQRADAADAEQHLLAEAVLGVAAVEAVGDVADQLAVLLDVGVEQQQRDAADLGHPDAGGQGLAAGQAEDDLGDGAVGLAQQRERQAVGVEDRVALLLPAVAGQGLAEVAVPVEQADADDRDAEVAGGLEVVAGEDAEAAGVLRQDRGDAELRGEVGDRAGRVGQATGTSGRRSCTSAGRPRQLAEAPQEGLVVRELLQALGAHGAEQTDRVVAGRLPGVGVDGGEEVLGLGVPGPAQVAGQLAEGARAPRAGRGGR